MDSQAWQNVDNINSNLEWKKYPSKYCKEDLKPHVHELEKSTQKTSDEDIRESLHPWCKSCYGLYSQICDSVAQAFGIPSHPTKLDRWKNTDLSTAVDSILQELTSLPIVSIIRTLNPLVQTLCNCIKSRWYHHGKCYFHSDKTNPTLVKSNLEHMKQITLMCTNVAKILDLYMLQTHIYKKYNQGRLPDDCKDFSKMEKQVFNICQNQIQKYSTLEHDVLCTDSPKPQQKRKGRSRSPDRDKELVKSAYEIPPEQIDHLHEINKYHFDDDYKL